MNPDHFQTELSSSPFGQLPDLSGFEPIEGVVDSPKVKQNKSFDVQKETPLSFPTRKEELLQIFNEPNHNSVGLTCR